MTHLIPPGIPPYSTLTPLGWACTDYLRALRSGREREPYSHAWHAGYLYGLEVGTRRMIVNTLGHKVFDGLPPDADSLALVCANLIGWCPDCYREKCYPSCPRFARDDVPSLPSEVEA